MKKIIDVVFTFFFITSSFSQFNILNKNEMYKEFGDVAINKLFFLDSNTIIARGVIVTPPIQRFTLFLTKIENGKYISKKINNSSNEYYGNDYLKNGDKIYRIRGEKDKKEILYFKDELINNEFIKSEIPFFKGAKENGYLLDLSISNMGHSFVLTTKVVKNYFVEKITLNYFDINTFELINKEEISFDPDHKILNKKVHSSVVDKTFILYYPVYNPVKGEMELTCYYTHEEKISKLIYPFKKGENIMNYVFLENNNEIQLFTFKIDTDFNSTISIFDIENETLEEVTKKSIPMEFIARDYTDKRGRITLTDQLNYAHFTAFDVINSSSNEKYIISYGANEMTDGSSYYLDIMVVKIVDDQVAWSQYFARNAKPFLPVFKETNDELQFVDHDVVCFYEENGVKKIRGKCIDLNGKQKNFIVKINKMTGELNREIIED